jgi:hypothetical protein
MGLGKAESRAKSDRWRQHFDARVQMCPPVARGTACTKLPRFCHSERMTGKPKVIVDGIRHYAISMSCRPFMR